MNSERRHNPSDKTAVYWDSMWATFKREIPVYLAGMQFKCSMELLDERKAHDQ